MLGELLFLQYHSIGIQLCPQGGPLVITGIWLYLALDSYSYKATHQVVWYVYIDWLINISGNGCLCPGIPPIRKPSMKYISLVPAPLPSEASATVSPPPRLPRPLQDYPLSSDTTITSSEAYYVTGKFIF